MPELYTHLVTILLFIFLLMFRLFFLSFVKYFNMPKTKRLLERQIEAFKQTGLSNREIALRISFSS